MCLRDISLEGEHRVCRLLKSLYGLKKASLQWNTKFSTVMMLAGFVQSAHDHSLFIKKASDHINLLLVYVDDIIIIGSNVNAISDLKSFLHSHIQLKDLGHCVISLALKFLDPRHRFISINLSM